MYNLETVLSSFDTKGTLLKWLKELEATTKNASLKRIEKIDVTESSYQLKFVFGDNSFVMSPVLEAGSGEGGNVEIIDYSYGQVGGINYNNVKAKLDNKVNVLIRLDGKYYVYGGLDGSNRLCFFSFVVNTYYRLTVSTNNSVNTSSNKLAYEGSGGSSKVYKHTILLTLDTILRSDETGFGTDLICCVIYNNSSTPINSFSYIFNRASWGDTITVGDADYGDFTTVGWVTGVSDTGFWFACPEIIGAGEFFLDSDNIGYLNDDVKEM